METLLLASEEAFADVHTGSCTHACRPSHSFVVKITRLQQASLSSAWLRHMQESMRRMNGCMHKRLEAAQQNFVRAQDQT